MSTVVAGPSTEKQPNAQGCLHELANRGDIEGFVMVMKLKDGTFEHYRVGLTTIEASYGVAVAQENLLNRIEESVGR